MPDDDTLYEGAIPKFGHLTGRHELLAGQPPVVPIVEIESWSEDVSKKKQPTLFRQRFQSLHLWLALVSRISVARAEKECWLAEDRSKNFTVAILFMLELCKQVSSFCSLSCRPDDLLSQCE